mmetsp:Transcript_26200/g.48878  ORF Transcript_26200/g.48878 Transcript_26200/m.48878 type:complete len:325 (+) Transcript_26200:1005-1979(+)
MADLLDDDCKGPSKTSPPRPPKPSPTIPDKALAPEGWALETPLTGTIGLAIGAPMLAGGTATGVAITSPPILETPSIRVGRGFLLDALPVSELFEETDDGPVLSPFGLFFGAFVRTFGSFVVSVAAAAAEAAFFGAFFVLERLRGVKGVRVVCGAGGSACPFTLCTPATTEAAVAPVGARGVFPLLELAAATALFRVAGAPAEGIDTFCPGAEVPAAFAGTAPVDAERVKGAADGVVPEAAAAAAEIVGNAEEPVATEAERCCADTDTGGGGTRFAVEAFAGSSKEGGGKTGFAEAFPVPDGPPPPVRRRGVEPAGPLAALKAC